MSKAYKVVKVLKNGSRVSLFVDNKNPFYRSYMNNGEAKVVASGFVFLDEQQAKDFAMDEEEVWEVSYSSLSFCDLRIKSEVFLECSDFNNFARKHKKEDYCTFIALARKKYDNIDHINMYGTAVAYNVKLERLVKERE